MPTTRPALGRCTLVGLAGGVLVLVGAAQAASPFTSKVAGSWFFGVPEPAARGAAPGAGGVVGVVCVWAGVALLLVAWYRIVGAVTASSVTPRALGAVLGAWLAPIVLCPPLFSRDVYAYVAQGELLAHGMSPYRVGPAALGAPGVVALVDPLWRHATAPYGPLFVSTGEMIVTVSRHHVLGSLVLLRAVAAVSVLVVAGATAVIARATGRDPARAVALVALNPLVLLVLVGGMHNDALMLAFLAGGVACAYRDRPVVGVVLCAVGATVKLPALVGVLAIGWVWADRGAPRVERLRRLGSAVTVGAGTLALVGVLAMLGWGWLWDVGGPGAVVSWLDPATAVGLAADHLGSALGLGSHRDGAVRVARALALAAAVVTVLVLVGRTERRRAPGALGGGLLAGALLGPAVWPWYVTWCVPFLATSGRRARAALVVVCTWACFADVPPASSLSGAGPGVVVLAVALALAAVSTGWLWCAPVRVADGLSGSPRWEGRARAPGAP